jgi:formylglycine-generating enzyme required for sulfatase activity
VTLALGFVAAWYFAGRLSSDRAALSADRPLFEEAARSPEPAARGKERARPAAAEAQISCGSELISVPRSDGQTPGPCPAGMVGVAGGPFVAGCTAHDCGRDPVCSVRDVRPFCIAETETTVRDYERCVEDDRHDDPEQSCDEPYDDDSSTYAAELERRPVNMVSWRDAAKYCGWLSTTHAFKGWTTRLPTSDEWEKAARGVAGNPFSWGDGEMLGAANLSGNDDSRYTANAGKFSADRSPYGALDMIGNVAEWVSESKAGRAAVKGGSFASPLDASRAWTARQLSVETTAADIGFRCVAVPQAAGYGGIGPR